MRNFCEVKVPWDIKGWHYIYLYAVYMYAWCQQLGLMSAYDGFSPQRTDVTFRLHRYYPLQALKSLYPRLPPSQEDNSTFEGQNQKNRTRATSEILTPHISPARNIKQLLFILISILMSYYWIFHSFCNVCIYFRDEWWSVFWHNGLASRWLTRDEYHCMVCVCVGGGAGSWIITLRDTFVCNLWETLKCCWKRSYPTWFW